MLYGTPFSILEVPLGVLVVVNGRIRKFVYGMVRPRPLVFYSQILKNTRIDSMEPFGRDLDLFGRSEVETGSPVGKGRIDFGQKNSAGVSGAACFFAGLAMFFLRTFLIVGEF